MASEGKKSWFRPRFTIAAMLLLITLCAPFLAYLSFLRRQNDLRQAAYDDAIAKGIRLQPESAAANTKSNVETAARQFWSTVVGDPKLPNFGRVQIHDFFGKNRPRPPITDQDLASLEYLPEIEDFNFYYSKDVTDAGISVLGKLPRLKRITLNELTLITGEFLDHFANDCALESLTLVSLKGLDGQKLKSLSRLKNLKLLTLDGGSMLNDESLRNVELSSSIKDLQLVGGEMGDETISRWLRQLQLERLELRVRSSRAILPGLAAQTSLTNLAISNAPLVDDDFAFLKNCARLKALQFAGLPLRGQILDYIAKPEEITLLELSNTLLTDNQLPKLAKFKGLKILDLSWTPITGEGFDARTDIPTPWSLSLTGARFSDAGKEKLANWKGLSSVSLPSNWSLEDDRRFAKGAAPKSLTYNAYAAPPSNLSSGPPIQRYVPTLKMAKIDNCPTDLMKPVADLQALGIAEYEEWQRKSEARP